MASIPLSRSALKTLKKAAIESLPDDFSSSHITEALASSLGFRTHAALLAYLPSQIDDPEIHLLDDKRFLDRLQSFGYSIPADAFSFDSRHDGTELISTTPISSYDIKYRSTRDQAWRNLMVCAINEGILRKYFSVRPNDNRWPGAIPGAVRTDASVLFDFLLPSGKTARCYLGDAGFGELAVHVAVNPNGDWVRASNAGFIAGDAFASGWLERKVGAWLQSTPKSLRCRRYLIKELAEMDVEPLGYGDKGGLII